MDEPIWTPSPERAAATELAAFRRRAERVAGVPLPDYRALHRFSLERRDEFWRLLWDHLGMIADRAPGVVVDDERGMRHARWFPGVHLSFAENLLRRRDDFPALVSWGEQGRLSALTFRELRGEVSRVAQGLARLGIGRGDRVAAILPNTPDGMIAMLAANSLGAIWSICSNDFGAQAVADRFGQIEPRVLFAGDGAQELAPGTVAKLRQVQERLPSVERTIVVARGTSGLSRAIPLAELVAPHAPREPGFVRVPFDEPSFVLFTSGTTGLPKCIVHGAGGFLLQLLKEHRLHYDVRPGDRYFYFTSTGWNMWYWLATALAAEATVILFEGSPFYPRAELLFDLAEEERVTAFGISPKYLATLRAAGHVPNRTRRLEHLRTVLSTGSPLAPELFDYVYEAVKRDVCLSSISGGTELNACFATGNPEGPVHRGELQVLALGMDVQVFDDGGAPLAAGTGELVCARSFPSQPVGFWGDPDGARYEATYFRRYPGVWHHGDFAELTSHGGMVIHGRSDATLKPGGHRIGTAEIYAQVEQLELVEDSIAIGQDFEGDVRIVLFVRLRPGAALDEPLRAEIRRRLRQNTSLYCVPARILQVREIPRTATGKKAELAVRSAVRGELVPNLSALANPEALEDFRDRPELAT